MWKLQIRPAEANPENAYRPFLTLRVRKAEDSNSSVKNLRLPASINGCAHITALLWINLCRIQHIYIF